MWWCCLLAVAVVLASGQQNFWQCGRSTQVEGDELRAEALLGEHPHMCTLYRKQGSLNVFLGGASLIWSNMVLTLATAVDAMVGGARDCGGSKPLDGLYVRCGEVHLQIEKRDFQSESRQDRSVQRVFLHPGYNNKTLTEDYAILVVDTPFAFTPEVGRVCLPSPNQRIPADLSCTATGHGKDGIESFAFYSPVLRQVRLPLWSGEKCSGRLNEGYFSTKLVKAWKAHPSHLCAGGQDNMDTCEGDGGGPLVCQLEHAGTNNGQAAGDDSGDTSLDLRTSGETKLVQVGITAWGIKCGDGLPGVYSNVAAAMCWIDQVMSCNQGDEPNIELDLRDSAVSSVNGFSETQCGAWQQTDASRKRSTCGCRVALRGGVMRGRVAPVDQQQQQLEDQAPLDLRGIQA